MWAGIISSLAEPVNSSGTGPGTTQEMDTTYQLPTCRRGSMEESQELFCCPQVGRYLLSIWFHPAWEFRHLVHKLLQRGRGGIEGTSCALLEGPVLRDWTLDRRNLGPQGERSPFGADEWWSLQVPWLIWDENKNAIYTLKMKALKIDFWESAEASWPQLQLMKWGNTL